MRNENSLSIERRKELRLSRASPSLMSVCDGVTGFREDEDEASCEEEAPFDGDSSVLWRRSTI